MTEPKLVKIAEAARLLSCHPQTLRGWESEGKGPRPVWINGQRRYRVTDIDAWVASLDNGS